MAKPFCKAQAHFIAPGQAPERDIITTRALFFDRLIRGLVGERHGGGIFVSFEKRIGRHEDKRCQKHKGMQPSGSNRYHPASLLARFATHMIALLRLAPL
jgi:hypothetical protein